MTRCSIKPRHQIYVKSYGFLSFAMSSSRMLDGCQKLLDHAKQSATNTLKTHSITAIQRQYK